MNKLRSLILVLTVLLLAYGFPWANIYGDDARNSEPDLYETNRHQSKRDSVVLYRYGEAEVAADIIAVDDPGEPIILWGEDAQMWVSCTYDENLIGKVRNDSYMPFLMPVVKPLLDKSEYFLITYERSHNNHPQGNFFFVKIYFVSKNKFTKVFEREFEALGSRENGDLVIYYRYELLTDYHHGQHQLLKMRYAYDSKTGLVRPDWVACRAAFVWRNEIWEELREK